MDNLRLALDLGIILASIGGIAWLADKLGLSNSQPQQGQDSAQLEQIHSVKYKEFFINVVAPMMKANADALTLNYPRGLAQHTPKPGNRVVTFHSGIAYVYVFQRKYNIMGGIKAPKKIYSSFPVADMKKELAAYAQNYCVSGGFPPCQDIKVKDIGSGKVLIGFVF